MVGKFFVTDEDQRRRILAESDYWNEFCESDEAQGNEYFEFRGNELVIAKELDYDNVAEY